jgi:hypothetical protein
MMTLPTVSPDYLIVRSDTDMARKTLRSAKARLEIMESRNDEHAHEVRNSRSGSPLITNGQALRRGSGSGFEVIHKRCRCDGFPEECTHDPREAPHSDADVAAAEKAITTAEKTLEAEEANLSETPHAFDAFANAREAGSRYVFWPLAKFVDPRRQRWQGQPVTDEDLAALGPHGLRQALTAGDLIEVT